MIRVGLYVNQLARWNGGLDFLQRLSDSLLTSRQHRNRIKVFFVVGIDEDCATCLCDSFLKKLKLSRLLLDIKHSVLVITSIKNWAVTRNAEEIHSLYSNLLALLGPYSDYDFSVLFFDMSRPWGLRLAITYAQIQILLPLIEPPPQSIFIPYIAYIYDLQHVHMSWYFSSEECVSRMDCFANLKDQAHALMFNSRYMLHEFDSCYGLPETRPAFSLPFAPQARVEWLNKDFFPTHQSLPSRPYLVVCNQFWIHKNHRTVLEAFEQISHLYDMDLVFTGALRDYRGHDHIASFLDKVNDMPKPNRVRVMGDVPKLQQIRILGHATMLIQPSEYEGGPGGGAVYDAIAMGVPVLLSDIEVNRECFSPWYIDFFSVNDSGDLASKISKYMDQTETQRIVEPAIVYRLTDESKDAVADSLIACIEQVLK